MDWLMVLAQVAQDAQNSVGTGGVLPLWAELGLGGVLFGLVLAKVIVPGWAYNEKKEERDKLAEETQRRTQVFEEKVIPALLESAAAIKQSTDLVNEMKFRGDK